MNTRLLTSHKNIAEGLLILDKYCSHGLVHATEGLICTTTDKSKMVQKDKDKLRTMGWYVTNNNYWMHNT